MAIRDWNSDGKKDMVEKLGCREGISGCSIYTQYPRILAYVSGISM